MESNNENFSNDALFVNEIRKISIEALSNLEDG